MSLFFTLSRKGPRLSNQDSFIVSSIKSTEEFMVGVADGVGGGEKGDEASSIALSELVSSVNSGYGLKEGIKRAHKAVIDSSTSAKGMATTLTAAIISESMMTGVHIGDTRIYVLRGKGIKQITVDHTEVADLYRQGAITKEEAVNYPRKNIITKALGSKGEGESQDFEFLLEEGDRVLFMSDGFYSKISKKILRDMSLSTPFDLDAFCKNAVRFVENQVVSDNYTLVAVQV